MGEHDISTIRHVRDESERANEIETYCCAMRDTLS